MSWGLKMKAYSSHKMFAFILALVGISLVATDSAQAKEGFYMGLGVGGGMVYGDDPVSFDWDQPMLEDGFTCNNNSDCITTEYAEGLGNLLRMGYNIMGVFGIESSILSHGFTGDTFEVQGHAIFAGVIHPIGIANLIETENGADVAPEMIFWDPYILAGGGLTWGLYEATIDKDDKGWAGSDFQWGMGLNMHFSRMLSAGVDMRWTYSFYDKWLFNYDDDITGTPTSDPVGLTFSPMATLTLHVN